MPLPTLESQLQSSLSTPTSSPFPAPSPSSPIPPLQDKRKLIAHYECLALEPQDQFTCLGYKSSLRGANCTYHQPITPSLAYCERTGAI